MYSKNTFDLNATALVNKTSEKYVRGKVEHENIDCFSRIEKTEILRIVAYRKDQYSKDDIEKESKKHKINLVQIEIRKRDNVTYALGHVQSVHCAYQSRGIVVEPQMQIPKTPQIAY